MNIIRRHPVAFGCWVVGLLGAFAILRTDQRFSHLSVVLLANALPAMYMRPLQIWPRERRRRAWILEGVLVVALLIAGLVVVQTEAFQQLKAQMWFVWTLAVLLTLSYVVRFFYWSKQGEADVLPKRSVHPRES